MRYCFVCDLKFQTDLRFTRHCVEAHGAPWARVERALKQNPSGTVVLVQATSGDYYLMHQAPLF